MKSETSQEAGRYYVYLLECSDTSFYIGSTNDLEQRVKKHNEGRGAKYTRTRLPVRLVYHESCKDKSEALRREHQLKTWSRTKKQALFAENKTEG